MPESRCLGTLLVTALRSKLQRYPKLHLISTSMDQMKSAPYAVSYYSPHTVEARKLEYDCRPKPQNLEKNETSVNRPHSSFLESIYFCMVYGRLSKLLSHVGSPKDSVASYIKDPNKDHSFDNHPYGPQALPGVI